MFDLNDYFILVVYRKKLILFTVFFLTLSNICQRADSIKSAIPLCHSIFFHFHHFFIVVVSPATYWQ